MKLRKRKLKDKLQAMRALQAWIKEHPDEWRKFKTKTTNPEHPLMRLAALYKLAEGKQEELH